MSRRIITKKYFIDSSMVKRVQYNKLTKELKIFFHQGKVYSYNNVERKDIENIINLQFLRQRFDSSAGKAVKAFLKDYESKNKIYNLVMNKSGLREIFKS